MQDKNSRKDWLSAVITASLGAGVVASFAINQGQHPAIALVIMGFAVVTALLIDHYA
jgi:hypothetical protein